jgi:hypothetical protein
MTYRKKRWRAGKTRVSLALDPIDAGEDLLHVDGCEKKKKNTHLVSTSRLMVAVRSSVATMEADFFPRKVATN